MKREIQTDVVMIGARGAGLYAVREIRRAGCDFLQNVVSQLPSRSAYPLGLSPAKQARKESPCA